MKLYHVLTQGDEDGRSTRALCYVRAESEEAAVAEAFTRGYMPYYTYNVCEVGAILQADSKYENLDVTSTGWGYEVNYRGLRKDTERKQLSAKLHLAGLNAEEIERCVNTLMGE